MSTRPKKALIIANSAVGTLGYEKALSNFPEFGWESGDFFATDVEEMIKRAENCDLVMFTGGSDIAPELYGGVRTNGGRYTQKRDMTEKDVYNAVQGEIPIIGICRGIQMLWALSGGNIIFDIKPKHDYWHKAYVGKAWQNSNSIKRVIDINSTHHQGIELGRGIPDGWEIVATAQYDGIPEAAINRELRIGGVQYHPELMDATHPGRKLFDLILNELL